MKALRQEIIHKYPVFFSLKERIKKHLQSKSFSKIIAQKIVGAGLKLCVACSRKKHLQIKSFSKIIAKTVGEVAEWFKAPASKAVVGLYSTVGSNPTLFAKSLDILFNFAKIG